MSKHGQPAWLAVLIFVPLSSLLVFCSDLPKAGIDSQKLKAALKTGNKMPREAEIIFKSLYPWPEGQIDREKEIKDEAVRKQACELTLYWIDTIFRKEKVHGLRPEEMHLIPKIDGHDDVVLLAFTRETVSFQITDGRRLLIEISLPEGGLTNLGNPAESARAFFHQWFEWDKHCKREQRAKLSARVTGKDANGMPYGSFSWDRLIWAGWLVDQAAVWWTDGSHIVLSVEKRLSQAPARGTCPWPERVVNSLSIHDPRDYISFSDDVKGRISWSEEYVKFPCEDTKSHD